MNILFIDTETTGLTKDNTILQIYAEQHINGKKVAEFNQKISLEGLVDLGALKVNNYRFSDSCETVSVTPFTEQTMLQDFCDWLLDRESTKSNPMIVCGHNVNFDITKLNERLEAYNIVGLGSLLGYRVLDTSTIGQFLANTGLINLERMSLQNLGEALQLDFDKNQLHDAKSDVKLTIDCYYSMLNLVKVFTHGKD